MVSELKRRITTLLTVIASVVLILMMTHIVLNAILRFSLGAPIHGTNEVVEYWYLPFVALIGIPAAQLNREQIVVNILTERMSRATARTFAWLVMLVAVAFSLTVTWFGLQTAMDQAAIGATGGVINIIVWPAYFLVPVTFLLLSFIFLIDLIYAEPQSDVTSGPALGAADRSSDPSTPRTWPNLESRQS